MSAKNKFRAMFRKVSTGQEIWQFVSLYKRGLCNPADSLPPDYIQVTDWEQYTGKKDMDGVEVFEGDIFETFFPSLISEGYDPIVREVVEYDYDMSMFRSRELNAPGQNYDEYLDVSESRVIGNINENKDVE